MLLVVLRDSIGFVVPEEAGLTQFQVKQKLLAQERSNTLEELKKIKQLFPELKIVVTDVKEAAEVFGLIPDAFDDTIVNSVETVRLIDYSRVVESKSSKIHKIENVQSIFSSGKLMPQELFTLKYKPNSNQRQLKNFVQESLQHKLNPYFETGLVETKDQVEVSKINRATASTVLSQTKQTVVFVTSQRCKGCQQIEPHLNYLKQQLNEKAKIQLVKIDVRNEIPFLADIQKTPTFLLYEKKTQQFSEIDLKLDNPLNDAEIGDNFEQLDDAHRMRQLLEVRLVNNENLVRS